MSEIHNAARLRNPWALHFQKLGLQLKCAVCLNLLNKPSLLPCNHIFCKFCIPKSSPLGTECPTCKHLFVDGEVRSAPFLENIITIYKGMDSTFNSTIFPHLSKGSRKSLNETLESVTIIDDKTRKKVDEVVLQGSEIGSTDGSSGTYRAKRLVDGDFDTTPGEIADRTFHQDPLHTRDDKRQKKLNYGLSASVGEGLASPSDDIAVSNLNRELCDAPDMDRTACVFCHSSKQTEEDFLMLCPTHNSAKFPRENSKSREFGSDKKDSLSTKTSSNALKFWEMSTTGPKQWFFCGSALSSEQKYLLVKFATMCGATVFKFWNPKVTHVIAATNAEGACNRTSIFLMAILSGCWILTMDCTKAFSWFEVLF